jgi:hypothetical protein
MAVLSLREGLTQAAAIHKWKGVEKHGTVAFSRY